MAKVIHDDVLDAALGVIDNADRISVCEGEPADYADMTTNKGAGGHKLAMSNTPTFQAITDALGGGRELAVDQEATIAVDVSGNADHVCLGISGSSKMYAATTCTLQALTAGNTVTIPTWKVTIGDPT